MIGTKDELTSEFIVFALQIVALMELDFIDRGGKRVRICYVQCPIEELEFVTAVWRC